jgi:hypothetical protein
VASLVRFRYGLPDGSPPCADRTGNAPALGDFYFQASDGSVTLPVAGYNYNSDWTPLLAGLSPAGMAASFAARSISAYSVAGVMSGSNSSGRWPNCETDVMGQEEILRLFRERAQTDIIV